MIEGRKTLGTPVQFQPELGELNAIRPIIWLSDVGRRLSIPMCAKRPLSMQAPAEGKLLKCDRNGALLENGYTGFENEESFEGDIREATPTQHFVFSQRVYHVRLGIVFVQNNPIVYWTDSTYTKEFQLIANSGNTFLDFVGTNLYIKGSNGVGWMMWYHATGYY